MQSGIPKKIRGTKKRLMVIRGNCVDQERRRTRRRPARLPKVPGEVVWDEFTSIPLVFIGLPNSISLANPKEMLIWLAVGFIYFRIFDILKPLGIRKIQYMGKGFGVMIDDVLAAAYAAGLLYLTFTFSLSFF